MIYPPISCYCSTYGRPQRLIENSIACFLAQDYPGIKELVILNDFVEQELIFDHPEVRIINWPERIAPLGAKFNKNVELCRFNLLATWEDDDVFLPHRLKYSYERMKNGVFHTHDAWFERNEKDIISARNCFHSTHLMTRDLFNKVGGYPTEVDICSIDISIMDKLRKLLGTYTNDTPEEDRFYIYVWSCAQSYHGSGWGPSNLNISQSAADIVQSQIKQGLVPTGKIYLEPKLRYNFQEYIPLKKNETIIDLDKEQQNV